MNNCLAVADECIRQMEWARREHPYSLIENQDDVNAGLEMVRADLVWPPLTLAPKGWKP